MQFSFGLERRRPGRELDPDLIACRRNLSRHGRRTQFLFGGDKTHCIDTESRYARTGVLVALDITCGPSF